MVMYSMWTGSVINNLAVYKDRLTTRTTLTLKLRWSALTRERRPVGTKVTQ